MPTLKLATALLSAWVLAGLPLMAQGFTTYDSVADAIQDRGDAHSAVVVSGDAVAPDGSIPVPFRPPTAWPAGAITANRFGRVVLITNGQTNIMRLRHPRLGFPGTGGPIPPLPIPWPYNPAVAPITGMTMNPLTGNVFLTDGAIISEHNPAAGMAVVWGPFPIPAIPGAPGPNFVTGLDIDVVIGDLYTVNASGRVARWVVGGGGLGLVVSLAWPFPGMLPPGAQATGVAIDRCSACPWAPAALLPRAVSWTSGEVITDAGVLLPGALSSQGLSYIARPQRLPSPAGMLALRARVSDFLFQWQPTDLLLSGADPALLGVPVAFLYHSPVAALPGGWALPGGEVWWLVPAETSGPFPFPVAADGTVTVPLGPLPYPFIVYLQWMVVVPGAPGGFEVSNALSFEVSRP